MTKKPKSAPEIDNLVSSDSVPYKTSLASKLNTISFFFSNVLVELNTERKKFGFEELAFTYLPLYNSF